MIRTSGKKAATLPLPNVILDELYTARQFEQCREMWRKGEGTLTDGEQKWKQGFGFVGTNHEVRQQIIRNIETTQKKFNTIVVGVDHKWKMVVIAGNIKSLDFMDLSIKMVTNQNGAEIPIVKAQITSVGFVESDYPMIKQLVMSQLQSAYHWYSIKVLSPSTQDLDMAVELEKQKIKDYTESEKGKMLGKIYRDPSPNEQRHAQAHYFHAEMQVKKYFEQNGGSLEGKRIMASKQYCVNCKDNLPQHMTGLVEGHAYKNPKMRWAIPEDVFSFDLANVPIGIIRAYPNSYVNNNNFNNQLNNRFHNNFYNPLHNNFNNLFNNNFNYPLNNNFNNPCNNSFSNLFNNNFNSPFNNNFNSPFTNNFNIPFTNNLNSPFNNNFNNSFNNPFNDNFRKYF